jgi:L-fuconolactonase
MIIDAHQHFWKYNTREYSWIDDRMKVLRRDYLPSHLIKEMSKVGVQGTIAVQARQTLEETSWLLGLAEVHDFIKGVVGWVDLRSSKVEDQLKHFSSFPKLVGIRHIVHDEPDDLFLLRTDFLNGINKLQKFNLSYDILIFEKHLPVTIRFVKKFPNQPFVVDHIAKPKILLAKMEPWEENIRSLAQFSNVYCKISGLVTEADWENWTENNFYPYLETVFDAFGAERIMIGSDWPVCTLAGSYQSVINIILNFIKELSDSEKKMVLVQNALKFYGLKMG